MGKVTKQINYFFTMFTFIKYVPICRIIPKIMNTLMKIALKQ